MDKTDIYFSNGQKLAFCVVVIEIFDHLLEEI
jgi:hypothetical protein